MQAVANMKLHQITVWQWLNSAVQQCSFL